MQSSIIENPWPFTLVLWPWLWQSYLCKLSVCINSLFYIVTHHQYNSVQHRIIKHPWSLSLAMWPWHWTVCLCHFLNCIKHLKIDILTHSIILYNIASLSILDHWPCCYKSVWVSFRLVLMSFIIWHSHLLPHKFVQHSIFKHPWPLFCWCDLNIATFVFVNSRIVLRPVFWKWT